MSELTHNQLKALDALLVSSSIEDAARRSGLSAKTVQRYLSRPEFDAAFRHHLQERVRVAAARLQSGCASAVDCLLEVIEDKEVSASVRIRAAVALLDLTRRWIEMDEFEQRLATLETAMLQRVAS